MTPRGAVLITTTAATVLVVCLLADVSPVLVWATAISVVTGCSARWAGVASSRIERPALVVAGCLVATSVMSASPATSAAPYAAWLVIAVAMARAAAVPAARAWAIAVLVAGAATIAGYSAVIRAVSVDTARLIVYPAVGHWGHYPEIGTLSALTLPLALGAGLRLRSRRGAAGAAVLGLVLVAGLAMSSARAAWVAAVAGCVVVVAPERRRGGVAIGLLVVTGLVVVSQAVVQPIMRGHSIDAAASARQVAWVRALSIWRAHPWAGWGPGQYRSAYRRLYGADVHSASETAHNLPLQVGVEMGLAGVLALSWLALRVSQGMKGRLAEAGVMVALGVRLMADIFDPTSFGVRVFVLSAILVGLAARAAPDPSTLRRRAGVAA